jgi:hypothetical protein
MKKTGARKSHATVPLSIRKYLMFLACVGIVFVFFALKGLVFKDLSFN